MSRRKKGGDSGEEGAPAWMTTYSDMITLLLAFFVLLFSFSTIDALKWKEIVSSLSGTPFVAIQALDPGGTLPESVEIEEKQPTPTPAPSAVIEEEMEEEAAGTQYIKEKFNELYERIQSHVEQNDLEYELNVTEEDDKIIVRMSNTALFDSGKINIKPGAATILSDLCSILNEYIDLIEVVEIEGHTDNVPISSARFETNWHLSSARALEVLMFCTAIIDEDGSQRLNIDGTRIKAVGLGEFRPVATNETPEGKEKNRRVEFIIQSIESFVE